MQNLALRCHDPEKSKSITKCFASKSGEVRGGYKCVPDDALDLKFFSGPQPWILSFLEYMVNLQINIGVKASH
jgi:hypothetical protein